MSRDKKTLPPARVAELVDAPDLRSGTERYKGSSPFLGTMSKQRYKCVVFSYCRSRGAAMYLLIDIRLVSLHSRSKVGVRIRAKFGSSGLGL